jgi:lysine 2,3-aminomutase
MEDLISEGHDSIAAQFLPSEQENIVYPEELADPIGDAEHSPVKGVIHRYPDRVLLKPSLKCAVHCRFCFRREQIALNETDLTATELAAAIQYIAANEQIWEVILTGGDPLLLRVETLQNILDALNPIEHVKVIRFHSRIPVVLPERINEELIRLLRSSPKSIWIAVHTNCAAELTPQAVDALQKLRSAGIPLVSQTVLLKGVNATKDELEALFRKLVELGVRPYYLHYPDLARGTNHFRIPLPEALALLECVRKRTSGLAIPNLALDIPGGAGKISLAAAHPISLAPNEIRVISPLTAKKMTIAYPA